MHQPKVKRSKFQPRTKSGISVSYGLGSSNYLALFPEENTIVKSKHVNFIEAQLGRLVEPKITHRPFIDFLNDDNILTGTQEKSIKNDSEMSEHKDKENMIGTTPEGEEGMKLVGNKDKTSEDDSSDNLSDEEKDPTKLTFRRYMKKERKAELQVKLIFIY